MTHTCTHVFNGHIFLCALCSSHNFPFQIEHVQTYKLLQESVMIINQSWKSTYAPDITISLVSLTSHWKYTLFSSLHMLVFMVWPGNKGFVKRTCQEMQKKRQHYSWEIIFATTHPRPEIERMLIYMLSITINSFSAHHINLCYYKSNCWVLIIRPTLWCIMCESIKNVGPVMKRALG